MVMTKRRIQWDQQSLHLFNDAVKYIKLKSPQNAAKVKDDVLAKVRELADRPEVHPPDKYKLNNSGNYRVFELHHYRSAIWSKMMR
jgi:plasmid stabilization system protein ParE